MGFARRFQVRRKGDARTDRGHLISANRAVISETEPVKPVTIYAGELYCRCRAAAPGNTAVEYVSTPEESRPAKARQHKIEPEPHHLDWLGVVRPFDHVFTRGY